MINVKILLKTETSEGHQNKIEADFLCEHHLTGIARPIWEGMGECAVSHQGVVPQLRPVLPNKKNSPLSMSNSSPP